MKPGTPGFVGGRLKEAREARGLTASSLAEILEVSRQAISQYETNKQTPRPEVMEKISRTLNLPLDFFSRPVRDEEVGRRVFYRSMSSATKSARTRAERRYGWLQDIVSYLDRFVSFPSVQFPDFSMPKDPGKISNEDIERLAEETRRFWGLGEGPISNVVWLLENKGSIVTREDMESDKLDAFSEWLLYDQRGQIPYIFLNAEKNSGFRSRYDIAHELGHLILHRNIEKRYITNKPTFKLIEEQAYRFGGAFLLPASTFSNDFSVPSLDSFRALKPKWKVSAAAMVYRSADLNLASKEQVQRLWRSRSRRGWIYKEPLDDQLPAEKPRLLSRIFQLLVDENVQSLAEIRSSLPFSARDIEKLAGLEQGFLEEKPAPIELKTFNRKRSVFKRNAQDKPGEVLKFRDTQNGNAT